MSRGGINWELLSAAGIPRERADFGKVSCLCLVRGGARHLRRALACYDAQTYPNKELVGVYVERDADCQELIDGRTDVRWVKGRDGANIGQRRNLSIEYATGEWVAIWDDDDWHAPQRIELQMAEMQQQKQLAVALKRELIYDEIERRAYGSITRRFWENSLMCKRELPDYELRWPGNAERGEDTPVLKEIEGRQWLAQVDCRELYVHVFHGTNVWSRQHHKKLRADALGRFDRERVSRLLDADREPWRADGSTMCATCGRQFDDHSIDPSVRSGIDGEPYLNLLCDGSRVKL